MGFRLTNYCHIHICILRMLMNQYKISGNPKNWEDLWSLISGGDGNTGLIKPHHKTVEINKLIQSSLLSYLLEPSLAAVMRYLRGLKKSRAVMGRTCRSRPISKSLPWHRLNTWKTAHCIELLVSVCLSVLKPHSHICVKLAQLVRINEFTLCMCGHVAESN